MEQRRHATNKTCKTSEEPLPNTTATISTPYETDRVASIFFFRIFLTGKHLTTWTTIKLSKREDLDRHPTKTAEQRETTDTKKDQGSTRWVVTHGAPSHALQPTRLATARRACHFPNTCDPGEHQTKNPAESEGLQGAKECHRYTIMKGQAIASHKQKLTKTDRNE